MADVKVCDRCHKVLSGKRAFLSRKPIRNQLSIDIFKPDRWVSSGEYRAAHTNHDLCEKCTEQLVEFLEGKSVDAIENT